MKRLAQWFLLVALWTPAFWYGSYLESRGTLIGWFEWGFEWALLLAPIVAILSLPELSRD